MNAERPHAIALAIREDLNVANSVKILQSLIESAAPTLQFLRREGMPILSLSEGGEAKGPKQSRTKSS